jgi:hypothetical protein
MKIKLLTTLIGLFSFIHIEAQVPDDFKLFGNWLNQGFEFSGTFYPTNFWNSETISLKDDYTFTKTNVVFKDNQLDTILHYGKWNWNEETNTLALYRDDERYYANGKIFIFEKEYHINYLSSAYFTFSDQKFNQKVEFRFIKEGTKQTFEENITFENSTKTFKDVKIDSLATYYFLVNTIKPSKRKKMYFDEFQYNIDYTESNLDKGVLNQIGSFSGAIKDFTDSSIRFIYHQENINVEYENGKTAYVENNYYKEITKDDNPFLRSEKFAEKEILIKNIKDIEISHKFNLSGISPSIVLFSTITTLFVAPLVSINYKTGDFNQSKYYTTAGIGLIGLGASISIYFIFRDKKMNIYQNDGVATKRTWRLERVRL